MKSHAIFDKVQQVFFHQLFDLLQAAALALPSFILQSKKQSSRIEKGLHLRWQSKT